MQPCMQTRARTPSPVPSPITAAADASARQERAAASDPAHLQGASANQIQPDPNQTGPAVTPTPPSDSRRLDQIFAAMQGMISRVDAFSGKMDEVTTQMSSLSTLVGCHDEQLMRDRVADRLFPCFPRFGSSPARPGARRPPPGVRTLVCCHLRGVFPLDTWHSLRCRRGPQRVSRRGRSPPRYVLRHRSRQQPTVWPRQALCTACCRWVTCVHRPTPPSNHWQRPSS